MTNRASDIEQLEVTSKQHIGGISFDWIMIVTTFFLLVGGYLDAWAHIHIAYLETFFTPWHAVVYSGFLMVAGTLISICFINHARGGTWQQAIPSGYELSVLGVFGFAIGGVGDMFWHILFGVERNIDMVLSPTHLALVLSAGFIMTGPFRSAWRRATTETGPNFLIHLSLPFVLVIPLSEFTLLTQMAHPFSFFYPTFAPKAMETEQLLAILGIIIQTIILMSFVLLAIRKWKLLFGTFTLIFTLNAIMLSFLHGTYLSILIAVLAGVIVDILYKQLQPSTIHLQELRLFAFAVPTTLYLVYFLCLFFTSKIVWTIHLSGGSIIVAGLVGWLMSYLLVPPQDSSE